jgi:hypothetical protein
MIIRDNITECGYCGGEIAQRPERAQAGSGRPGISPAGRASKASSTSRAPPDEPGPEGDEEDGGGLSPYLQPGEQVLIGSLNVSVKKFFFHAYLTNQRVFLIDTQEKKLKVVAKDVPRDTIAGCIVEFSENSDPVLVLSIRSPDDDIKTMKLVFVQNGMDRSGEIDEWIVLIQNEEPAKKSPKRPAQKVAEPEEPPEPEMPEEEPVPTPPKKPVQKPELRPARKPTKDLEKQPPVKRLLSMYNVPEVEPADENEPEVPVSPPPRKAQVRQVTEHPKKPVVSPLYDREIQEMEESDLPQAPKPEVQSAMKVAMKSAMRPIQQQHTRPVKRMVSAEPEQERPVSSPRRPVVHEPPQEKHIRDDEVTTTTPQFCHNCGKKLPHSANFCPGCGTKLSQSRTLPKNRHSATVPDKQATRTDPPVHEQRGSHDDEFDDEVGEMPVVTKPAIKKAPKGSEMTILHKFLRR